MKPNYNPLWRWVIEREALRIRKEQGDTPPWTEDPILRKYRFCNVRREDDRVTIWIRENIRKPFAGHPLLWFMLCIARQINWPDTLDDIMRYGAWPESEDFKPRDIAHALNARKARGQKMYTGAYMISAPAEKGADKQSYIAETVLGDLWRRRDFFPAVSIQQTHRWLMASKGWGHFMSYQACVDMRFTALLRDAPDVSTWAAAGPGTIRGLNRIYGRPVDSALSQGQALREMRLIFERIKDETDVDMDFSDVPNCLCETDKWLRVKLGEGEPRALYKSHEK